MLREQHRNSFHGISTILDAVNPPPAALVPLEFSRKQPDFDLTDLEFAGEFRDRFADDLLISVDSTLEPGVKVAKLLYPAK